VFFSLYDGGGDEGGTDFADSLLVPADLGLEVAVASEEVDARAAR
jgi:hypothetical protein